MAMWLDHGVPEPESMSREALIALTRRQAEVIARQDAQITMLATQLADVSERLEQALKRLAELEHLLSRNSGNSSVPPSKDDGPGRTPWRKDRRAKPSGRGKGKQPGAPGTALRWREEDELDDHQDRYPEGVCGCGANLAEAADMGVVDRPDPASGLLRVLQLPLPARHRGLGHPGRSGHHADPAVAQNAGRGAQRQALLALCWCRIN